jgi:hypothetical protein
VARTSSCSREIAVRSSASSGYTRPDSWPEGSNASPSVAATYGSTSMTEVTAASVGASSAAASSALRRRIRASSVWPAPRSSAPSSTTPLAPRDAASRTSVTPPTGTEPPLRSTVSTSSAASSARRTSSREVRGRWASTAAAPSVVRACSAHAATTREKSRGSSALTLPPPLPLSAPPAGDDDGRVTPDLTVVDTMRLTGNVGVRGATCPSRTSCPCSRRPRSSSTWATTRSPPSPPGCGARSRITEVPTIVDGVRVFRGDTSIRAVGGRVAQVVVRAPRVPTVGTFPTHVGETLPA